MSKRARAGGGVLEPRFRRAVAGVSVLAALKAVPERRKPKWKLAT